MSHFKYVTQLSFFEEYRNDAQILRMLSEIKIDYTGNNRWALRRSGECFNRILEGWQYEISPSNRSEEFLESCRYGTMSDAVYDLPKAVDDLFKENVYFTPEMKKEVDTKVKDILKDFGIYTITINRAMLPPNGEVHFYNGNLKLIGKITNIKFESKDLKVEELTFKGEIVDHEPTDKDSD